MSESEMTTRVILHWVPATDERGRVRLEMCWSDPARAVGSSAAAPAAVRGPAASHAA